MKIKEVRSILTTHSRDDLELIICELSKMIPKKLKDEKNIDDLLKNPKTFVEQKKRVKKKPLPDSYEVFDDTKSFLFNAKNGYYFIPNQFVHKKERPKWRFIVKRLYKDLLVLAKNKQNQEDQEQAASLLLDLYQTMCSGIGIYLFTSGTPFETSKISQSDFLKELLLILKPEIPDRKWLQQCVMLACHNKVEAYYFRTIIDSLLIVFSTIDLKEGALEEALKLKSKFVQKGYRKSLERIEQLIQALEEIVKI